MLYLGLSKATPFILFHFWVYEHLHSCFKNELVLKFYFECP